MDNPSNNSTAQEVILTRVVNAPRDLVFETYTDCKHLKKWWGPKGFTMSHCELDLRPGGRFHYCLQGPDGNSMWGKFIYQDINRPELLSYIVSFSDKEGNITRHPLSPDWPREVLSITTFTEDDGKTTITIRVTPYNATEAELKAFEAGREGLKAGTKGMLDQLEEYLKS